MATAMRPLCRGLIRASRVTPAKRKCPNLPLRPQLALRSFSISTCRPAEQSSPNRPSEAQTESQEISEEREDESLFAALQTSGDDDNYRLPTPEKAERLVPTVLITAKNVHLSLGDEKKRANYESMSSTEREEFLSLQNHYFALAQKYADEPVPTDTEVAALTSEEEVARVDRMMETEFQDKMGNPRANRREVGYWAEEEDDEFGYMPDDDDDYDESMISSIAENQLDLHRDIREYTRVAMWEMPMLGEFAKPYQPPNYAEQPLRFRYTNYLGETHPAARKVVCTFQTIHLSLTSPQRIKLIKLLGPRYDPATDTAKISSEKFEHPAQNKRYLGDLVNSLVTEAKEGKDTLEDIPLDFRHHEAKMSKQSRTADFPEEWNITKERVQEIATHREAKDGQGRQRLREIMGGAGAGKVKELSQGQRESQARIAEYAMAKMGGRGGEELRR